MKLKAFFGIAFAALVISAFSSSVAAQPPTGGSQQARATEISGKVVRVGDDDFVLNTGKEQILVDADDDALRQAKLSPGEEVTVSGQNDDDNFDAYTITRSNGTKITVRD
jgi:uncharacterized protein YdeI (BOF family)